MIFRNNPINKSVLIKIIIFIFIAAIPLYWQGIIIYKSDVKTIKDQVVEITRTRSDFLSYYFEQEVRRIKDVQYGFVNNYTLNHLANRHSEMDDITTRESIVDLQKELMTANNTSFIIEDVIVLIPLAKLKISSQTGFDTLLDVDVKIAEELMRGDEVIRYANNYYYLSTKMKYYTETLNSYYVVFKLAEEKLSGFFRQSNENIGVFSMTENGSVIINGSSPPTENAIIHELLKDNRVIDKDRTVQVIVNDKKYNCVFSYSDYLQMYTISYIPQIEMEKNIWSFMVDWVVLIAILSIVIIVSILYLYRSIYRPLKKLVRCFNEVNNGNIDVLIEYTGNDEFKHIYEGFNSMTNKIKQLISEVYLKEILVQKMKLKHLQSQINPHFLYNNFFLISSMARTGDMKTIGALTKYLGEFFKYITKSDSDEIPLKNEVDHAVTFARIQEMRFKRRVTVIVEPLPVEMENVIVPKLIIQPIVENSFKYALEKRPDNGILKISFSTEIDKCSIMIEDNGNGFTDSELERIKLICYNNDDLQETSALANITKRLKLMHRDNGNLFVSKSDLGGLKVEIIIPLKQNF